MLFMTKTFCRSLSKKKIMSNDGMLIGTIKNIMVDLGTGEVLDLIVKPDDSFNTDGFKMDGDKMFVPFEAVKDIKDYIVVDRYLLKKSL
jgi:sporulation protein YlmC with PRC-barrel domain